MACLQKIFPDLQSYDFTHLWVNHKKNFVDPNNHIVHTQNIENIWCALRRFLRGYGTNYRNNLEYYISEFILRRKSENFMFDLISLIKING